MFKDPMFPTVQEIQQFARNQVDGLEGFPEDWWVTLPNGWQLNIWERGIERKPWLTIYYCAGETKPIDVYTGISMPYKGTNDV